VDPKNQLHRINLPHSSILPPPVTATQRVVKFQEMSLSKA